MVWEQHSAGTLRGQLFQYLCFFGDGGGREIPRELPNSGKGWKENSNSSVFGRGILWHSNCASESNFQQTRRDGAQEEICSLCKGTRPVGWTPSCQCDWMSGSPRTWLYLFLDVFYKKTFQRFQHKVRKNGGNKKQVWELNHCSEDSTVLHLR